MRPLPPFPEPGRRLPRIGATTARGKLYDRCLHRWAAATARGKPCNRRPAEEAPEHHPTLAAATRTSEIPPPPLSLGFWVFTSHDQSGGRGAGWMLIHSLKGRTVN
ncbi:Os11g0447650 [Oryza sativa Japonica Group]|uniref:Os11g0447650 protein n=1 Tax=Oryza sativa subsp. japonica TaxID=39947 RepID=A0A0P0Y1V6_ORYSJ|nr:Os11g0447650 [Oryza sativa Japonica Group]